jgi:ATP-dependent Lhr-like helicase
MQHLGPTSARELGSILSLPASEIEKALMRMEAAGTILRGKFVYREPGSEVPQEEQWCERRLLACPQPYKSRTYRLDNTFCSNDT